MPQVACGRSQYHSDNLSENVKRGTCQKPRRRERIRKTPLGYVNNPKTRNIDPDPTKSKIVVQWFEDFASGLLGAHQFFVQIMKYKGEVHEGKCEPLINNEIFELCRQG